ncbi:coiled-coil domain-containing protein 158-like isoform X2 [Leucoraja erinacea]|uniref:coiled-coil domain-containing protein 158-like isoform X2 n=1 Tax=Leucoraja erinaceus TaxID=7782 RepID=UPI002458B24B|nr:coiled-coil domain-containing protein 158-like isoform X2 [Leucoraja erinacea]
MSTAFETDAKRRTEMCWSFAKGEPLTRTSSFDILEANRSRERARGHLSSADCRSCQSSLLASEAGNKAFTSYQNKRAGIGHRVNDGSMSEVGWTILESSVPHLENAYGINGNSASKRPSKNLEELRKELERQTKETRKLQEEVELATKLTMDKFSWTFNDGKSCNQDQTSTSHSDKPKTDRSLTTNFPNVRSPIRSSVLQASISKSPRHRSPQTTKYDVDLVVSRKTSAFGTLGGERSLDDCVNEGEQSHEQSKFNVRRSMMDLQSKLQELQEERDSLMDLRLKESQDQGALITKLHSTVQQLETVNRMQDETVRDANTQIEQLRKKTQVYDSVLNEIHQALIHYEDRTGNKIYEHETASSSHIQNMGTAVDKVLKDMDAEIAYLKERLGPIEEELSCLRTESQSKTEQLLKQQEDRIVQLKHEHKQELSLLTGKVNRSRSFASSFQNQVETVQEQARNQSIMYSRQLTDLESTVCHLRTELREARRMYEDKIEKLENILEQSQSEVCITKKERDEFRQEVETLSGRIQQLMADNCKVEEDLKVANEQNQKLWDRGTTNSISVENMQHELDCKNLEIQRLDGVINSLKEQYQHHLQYQASADEQRNEDQEKITSLVNQYENCREQLCKTGEELNKRKQQLDKTEGNTCQLREWLKEKERCLESEATEKTKLQLEIEDKNQKIHRMKIAEESICDQFEEAVAHLKKMQNENDSLKMELSEKANMLTVLRQEMENIADMTSQQSSASEALQAERKQLQKDVDCQKQKIQELKTELEHKDIKMQELQAHLSELEREKIKMVNSATDQMSELGELLQEKEELATDLKHIQDQMSCLKEEYNNLQRTYASKTKEYEWSTNKLRAQLKSAQNDLDQNREAMKVLEGADSHAMKVAMGMQKQITAKRGQIDALQSKIQFLEEALENSEREKCYLKEEKVRLTKELACIVSERNKIAGELDSVKSQEKSLRDKLMRLESALEKACLRFSDCQSVIQRQEQDFMRLKLQHALEVKELQGPNFGSTTCPYPNPRGYSPPTCVNPSPSRTSPGYLSNDHTCPRIDTKLNNTCEELGAFPAGCSSKAPSRTCCLQEDLNPHLTNILMDLKNTVCDGCNRSTNINYNECEGEQRSRNMHAVDDLDTDVCRERGNQDSLFREQLTCTSDVKDPFNIDHLTCSDHSSQIGGPCYTTCKWEPLPERSPVSSLLTGSISQGEHGRETSAFSELCDSRISYIPAQYVENEPRFQNNGGEQTDVAGQACKKLQNKLDGLQNLVEDLQLKNHEMSSMIRSQEKRIKRVKDREKMLKK